MSAEEMKLSMTRTRMQNRNFEAIPTHYIIGCSWDFLKVNELDKVVWATLNDDANWNWIHIEIVGDFNTGNPTDIEYQTLRWLMGEITKKYPWIEIKKHSDFQPKSCPWKNFDMDKAIGRKYETFSLSRYYSPMPNQTRYYNNKTYEQDKMMNCWPWDCLVTANGTQLSNDMKYKTVACDKVHIGRKLFLEWIWVVQCNDVWSAINWQDIDMWCWVGMEALDNWSSCPTGNRKWYWL